MARPRGRQTVRVSYPSSGPERGADPADAAEASRPWREGGDPPGTGGYRYGGRLEYLAATLDEADLLPTPQRPTPWAMVSAWLDDALAAAQDPATAAALPEPTAMVVGTVDAAGRPRSRTVLLRDVRPEGFTFFTGYASAKGRDLAGNGWVSLCFAWLPLQRQLLVRGYATRVSADVTRAYFVTRPWASRIGAWASRQSQPIADRAELEARWADLARRWPDTGSPDDVPVPDFWGGFLVRPVEVEFWQGRRSRLHDRLVFLPASSEADQDGDVRGFAPMDDPGAWRVERRQP